MKTVRGIRGVSPERYSVTRRVHWSRASASRLDWIQRNWDGWCSVGLCTVNKPSPVPDRQNCIQQTVVSMVKDKNDGLYRIGDRIVSCDRSFSVAEPYVWNRISATLRQITSYGQFRRHLQTHLFKTYKSQCIETLDSSALYRYSYLMVARGNRLCSLTRQMWLLLLLGYKRSQ